MYQVGIITVSDTAHRNASADKTGPLLKDHIEGAQYSSRFKVVDTRIVPDEEDAILQALSQFGKGSSIGGQSTNPSPVLPVQLCITTGGTGFALRDVTPEAVRKVIVREATGLQHLLLSVSLQKTPMAALARPIAGVTAEGMLIVTVPGSPKGALENTEAILKIVPHALDLLSGGSGKEVHRSMGMPDRQSPSPANVGHSNSDRGAHSPPPLPPRSGQTTPNQQHGHHHHHHHHGHTHQRGDKRHYDPHPHSSHGHQGPVPRTVRSMDPSKGVSGRHRVSPYPIISLEEAYERIFTNTPILAPEERVVNPSLTGAILAEDVYSDLALPVTRTTNVDGYAVAASSTPAGVYSVLTSATYPGSILSDPLPKGHIYRINTGAPLPVGTDAVVMVEDTDLVEEDEESKEEKKVKLLSHVDRDENVRLPGSDVRKGDLVLEKGTRFSELGGELGTLVFVGRKHVSIHRRPKVAILSTGNELSELSAQTDGGAWGTVIYDSNRPSLETCLRAHGFDVVDLGIVRDDEKSTTEALVAGCREADVIITTGGTSMGEGDLLKPVIERNLKGTVHFGRVAMKPGKPTTFATVPPEHHKSAPTLIFALPGNPASALVTFHLFVLPALRKMSGFSKDRHHLARVKVKTLSDMWLDPRPEFHRVWVEPIPDSPYLVAKSTGSQRSSRTVSLANSNAMVCLPSSKDSDVKEIKAGGVVDAILIGSLS